MSFAWSTMLHIKKLMEMHNKETYTHVCARIDICLFRKYACIIHVHVHCMHSSEISELHCNQLRLTTLQEEFVWCLFEVISSFCLFRGANSGFQITNYLTQRCRLHRLEVGLHRAASKWLWQEVKVQSHLKDFKTSHPI